MHSQWRQAGASNNAILVAHCDGRVDPERVRAALGRFLDACPWPAARLRRTRPWGALSMSVCLLSLLGFPGTFGFIGKWLIMGAALERGQAILPVLVGLGSLVSLGYYLPVIMAMTMKPERSPEVHRQVLFSRAGKVVIAGAVAVIIAMGIWPRIPLELGRRTVNSMTLPSVVATEQP